jgi:hypothetical protein
MDFMVCHQGSLSALRIEKANKRQLEIVHSVTYKRDEMYGISSFKSTIAEGV